VAWSSCVFSAITIDSQVFALRLQVTSVHNLAVWQLITVYGPTREPARLNFVSWLYSLNIAANDNYLILGDFNFYRSASNRNRPGGNVNDMLVFNDIIHSLGLIELPLKGRSYTWSNMPNQPLMQQLDRFFTSSAWTLAYPNTVVLPLAKSVSNHTPCKIQIGTHIPKATLFRFENYWTLIPGFMDIVSTAWFSCSQPDAARNVSAQLKALRATLNTWNGNRSNLQILIKHCNIIIEFLDDLEELTSLHAP
jgi:hypothetical protein